MKIGITLSALTAVSFADCNGIYYTNGMALYPIDACMVVDDYSTDYTCDDDDGYINVYLNDACSGDADVTYDIATVLGDEFVAVCDASSDCSYSTFSGTTSNTTDSCDADDGTYLSISFVTECSDVGNQSVQISCVDGESSLVTFYDSTGCSGDELNSTSFEECLTCGAAAMTVKLVQVLVVVMWIAMA